MDTVVDLNYVNKDYLEHIFNESKTIDDTTIKKDCTLILERLVNVARSLEKDI